MATNKPKKETKPNWRHYNFTTAGPVDDYLYSMLPKRDEVLAEMKSTPASTTSLSLALRLHACYSN